MMIRGSALAVAAVAVAGCRSQVSSSTGTTKASEARPYQLYTHCGIEWAKVDGTFWRATRPLSDRSGDPPAGWGNPFENGTLVFLTPTKATFHSPAGSGTFERSSRTRPPLICS
jgi:hypothetical protein